uniref:Uncharacterized protein n=1 Tax=Aotus nancymaae TaxID=37293 RepID=A0A2K5D7I4_AOTNA
IQAETVLEGLGAGLHQAVRRPGGMASEPPPARLKKAFLAQSTLLESTLEETPEWAKPHTQRSRGAIPRLPSAPTEPPPCPPGRNHPLCPCSGRGGGCCSTPSLPSSSTFSVFSSGCWNPSVKQRQKASVSR